MESMPRLTNLANLPHNMGINLALTMDFPSVKRLELAPRTDGAGEFRHDANRPSPFGERFEQSLRGRGDEPSARPSRKEREPESNRDEPIMNQESVPESVPEQEAQPAQSGNGDNLESRQPSDSESRGAEEQSAQAGQRQENGKTDGESDGKAAAAEKNGKPAQEKSAKQKIKPVQQVQGKNGMKPTEAEAGEKVAAQATAQASAQAATAAKIAEGAAAKSAARGQDGEIKLEPETKNPLEKGGDNKAAAAAKSAAELKVADVKIGGIRVEKNADAGVRDAAAADPRRVLEELIARGNLNRNLGEGAAAAAATRNGGGGKSPAAEVVGKLAAARVGARADVQVDASGGEARIVAGLSQQSGGGAFNARFNNLMAGQTGEAEAAARMRGFMAVHELMDRIKGALRDPGLESNGTKLSLDFTSATMGQVRMAMSESGGNLSVSLSADNEAARRQMAGQRDELAEQIRQLGFKQVSIDFTGGGESGGESEAEKELWQAAGNEIFENVKLAGDADSDLEAAKSLAMA